MKDIETLEAENEELRETIQALTDHNIASDWMRQMRLMRARIGELECLCARAEAALDKSATLNAETLALIAELKRASG
jgi:hypothetical protein